MDKIKMIFQHTMMISFGILVAMCVEGIAYHMIGDDIQFQWYHPLSILLAGFLCAVVSLLIWTGNELPLPKFAIRIGLHCVGLFVVVMGMGYVFHWYNGVEGAVWVAVEYIFVYAFVWGATYWMGYMNQQNINQALTDIRDEE